MQVPRMLPWYIVTAALLVAIHYIAPQQLTVVVYKVCLVTLAALLAYLIDRSLYKRAGDRITAALPRDNYSAARILSRALVFVACVLGVSLGL